MNRNYISPFDPPSDMHRRAGPAFLSDVTQRPNVVTSVVGGGHGVAGVVGVGVVVIVAVKGWWCRSHWYGGFFGAGEGAGQVCLCHVGLWLQETWDERRETEGVSNDSDADDARREGAHG